MTWKFVATTSLSTKNPLPIEIGCPRASCIVRSTTDGRARRKISAEVGGGAWPVIGGSDCWLTLPVPAGGRSATGREGIYLSCFEAWGCSHGRKNRMANVHKAAANNKKRSAA